MEKQLEKPTNVSGNEGSTVESSSSMAMLNIYTWYFGVMVGSIIGIYLASLLLKRTIYVS